MEYTQQEKDQFIKAFTRDQIISQVVGSIAILVAVVGIPLGIYLYETSLAAKRADSLQGSYIAQSQKAPPAAEKVRSGSPAFALPPVSDKEFLEAEAVPDLIQQIQDLMPVEETAPAKPAGAARAVPGFLPSSRVAEEAASLYSYTNNSSSGSGSFAGGAGGGKGAGGGSGGGSLATSSPLAQTAAPSLSLGDAIDSPPLSWQNGILVGDGRLTHDVAIPAAVTFSPGHSPGTLIVDGSTLTLGNILQIEITDTAQDLLVAINGGTIDITHLETIEIIGEPPLDFINSQQVYEFSIIDYTNGTLIGSLDDVVLNFSGMPFKSGTLENSGGIVSANILHNPEMPSSLLFPVFVLIGSLLLFLRRKLVQK